MDMISELVDLLNQSSIDDSEINRNQECIDDLQQLLSLQTKLLTETPIELSEIELHALQTRLKTILSKLRR